MSTLDRHREREVALLATFERSLKILNELLVRLEIQMFPADGGGRYNPEYARDAVNVARALSQTGAVHARLLSSQSAAAENLSPAEKLKFMLGALVKYSPTDIRRTIEALNRTLEG